MSGADVQRSLRRVTALLLVPSSLLLVEFGIHLREQHGIVQGWQSQVIATSQVLGGLFVLGAAGYLAASVLSSLAAASE